MVLDISFLDRFLNISDLPASNARIIFDFERVWKEPIVV
jgi:hypothetical protein